MFNNLQKMKRQINSVRRVHYGPGKAFRDCQMRCCKSLYRVGSSALRTPSIRGHSTRSSEYKLAIVLWVSVLHSEVTSSRTAVDSKSFES